MSPFIHPIFSVIGCSLKSAVELPVNLLTVSVVKIISCSRKTTIPVILCARFIVPAPSATAKLSTVDGAVNNSLFPLV